MPDKAKTTVRELRAENRSADRKAIRLEVQSASSIGTRFVAAVYNLSGTGLLLGSDIPLSVNEQIFIDLPRAGPTAATVAWAGEGLFGCKFAKPISRAVLGAAQLLSPPHLPEATQHSGAPDSAEPFHVRLRQLRKEVGLGVAELAEIMSVSAPSIWNWETGKARPKQKNLSALAQALKTTVPELLFGTPNAPLAEEDTIRGSSATDAALGQIFAESGPTKRHMAATSRLSQLLTAHKEQIAVLTGTDATKVKILVEF